MDLPLILAVELTLGSRPLSGRAEVRRIVCLSRESHPRPHESVRSQRVRTIETLRGQATPGAILGTIAQLFAYGTVIRAMLAFNLSVDFELAWGDLDRAAQDDSFYERIRSGLDRCGNVVDVLQRAGIPSTWGIVGGCCCRSLEELRERSAQGYNVVATQLEKLKSRRPEYASLLFCPDAMKPIIGSPLIEIGSHGFMHLVPTHLPVTLLQADIVASVRVLRELTGKAIESFIPPQNYRWPDGAFSQSGIKYIRHTPTVFGHSYSAPDTAAKFARLWNDFVAPVDHSEPSGQNARLLFLRIDRGRMFWKRQLRMLRSLLGAGRGSVYCFTHPHNLDTPAIIARFAEFCDVVAEYRAEGKLVFRKFLREPACLPA